MIKRPTHFFDERGGRHCIILFFMCVFSFPCTYLSYGQYSFSTGAPSNGLAGAVCAIPDEIESLQSVASSAFAEHASISSHYKNHYLLPEIHTISAVGLFPVHKWVVGIAAQKMGPAHYQELTTGLSIAHSIAHTALGLRINWQELYIEGFKTQHALIFEFGGIVNLSPRLHFGASVYNFTLSKLDHKLLPVVLRCGLNGKTNTPLVLSVELEKNNYNPLSIKCAAQYEFSHRFKVSIGYAYPASKLHAGFIVSQQRIKVSYSLSWHMRLGLSQDFSIFYTLKKKTT